MIMIFKAYGIRKHSCRSCGQVQEGNIIDLVLHESFVDRVLEMTTGI